MAKSTIVARSQPDATEALAAKAKKQSALGLIQETLAAIARGFWCCPLPTEWRSDIHLVPYGVSSFLYSLGGVLLLVEAEELGKRFVPRELSASVWIAHGWAAILMGFLSFWSDYVTRCRPSWSHPLYLFLGPFWACLWVVDFGFVCKDWPQIIAMVLACVHKMVARSASAYYIHETKDVKRFMQWHVQSAVVTPVWVSFQLVYVRFFIPPGRVCLPPPPQEKWYFNPYPDVWWTVVFLLISLLVCSMSLLGGSWAKGIKVIERQTTEGNKIE